MNKDEVFWKQIVELNGKLGFAQGQLLALTWCIEGYLAHSTTEMKAHMLKVCKEIQAQPK